MSHQSQEYGRTIVGMTGLLYIASALVLLIGLTLFLFPGRTDTLFSWTVNPPLTAAFLGAAYLSAFIMEFLGARETLWARTRVAIPAVLIFTFLTLVATLVHIDKFHFGSKFGLWTQAGTWVWLLVYAIVPVAMTVLLILQLRVRGIDPPRTAPMSSWIRLEFVILSAVALVAGIALFVVPKPTADLIWSWPLSALTGRAVGAWLIGVGVAAGHIAWENDWLRARPATVSFVLFGALQLVAILRFALSTNPATGYSILNWGDLRLWIYLLFLAGILVSGVYGWWAAQRAAAADPE